MAANKEITRDQNAAKVLDERSLESDYRTLVPILKPGIHVLDVGCGTGAISSDISRYVGTNGQVTGIDNTEKFIVSGKIRYQNISNLELIHADLFSFEPNKKFDLIICARVLQWLNNPLEALLKMKSWLKPNGQISVLDYNHEEIEWKPEPPKSMRKFYKSFLSWRQNSGMNNHISNDLEGYFRQAELSDIVTIEANELYKKGETSKFQIWSRVAGLIQIVEEGYIKEEERLLAIEEYDRWIMLEAEEMTLKLKEVRGRLLKQH